MKNNLFDSADRYELLPVGVNTGDIGNAIVHLQRLNQPPFSYLWLGITTVTHHAPAHIRRPKQNPFGNNTKHGWVVEPLPVPIEVA